MNRVQAKKVTALFGELADSGKLNYDGRYYRYRVSSPLDYYTFSPIGHLIFQARDRCPYTPERDEFRIERKAMSHWQRVLSTVYGMTVDEAQIIQDEWLAEHDVGNLIRMPMMVREED